MRIAQDLLGHVRSDMTLDTYTSSVPAATREAVSRLGEVFARARTGRRGERLDGGIWSHVFAPGWCQPGREFEHAC